MDGSVRRLAAGDLELVEQVVEAKAVDGGAEADADRAVGVMRAHRDHRVIEPRIAHAGHGEKELASQVRAVGHHASIARQAAASRLKIPAQRPR